MAKNNPANDRYNPPSNLENEYEKINFSELNIGELIWLSDKKSDSNHSYRKINEGQAMNLHTRETVNFGGKTKVYYRT
tara:strand:- start:138 stop:371 length:234 start_codon:yes stop_codon:yes gene_type:complete